MGRLLYMREHPVKETRAHLQLNYERYFVAGLRYYRLTSSFCHLATFFRLTYIVWCIVLGCLSHGHCNDIPARSEG